MATLQYNGNEYNILYIDANIAEPGDGSTPALALATIPSPLVDKTCYLIRRQEDNEVTQVDLPQSWYESLNYIMFLGMPVKDDPIYNLMEEDVKTAWGADAGKYARIRCNMTDYYDCGNYHFNNNNNKTLFKTNSIKNFYAANCYFYRDGNGGAQNNYAYRFGWIFGFDYGTRFADITFNNCKFGYTQYNLENNDYISSNTDIPTDTSKYPQYKAQSYVCVRRANSITFNNCTINHVSCGTNSVSYREYYYMGIGKCIWIGEFNKCIFTKNQYNVLFRSNNIGNWTEELNNWMCGICIGNNHDYATTSSNDYFDGDYAPHMSNILVKDLEINRIYTKTGACIYRQSLLAVSYNTRVDNVKVNHKVMSGEKITAWGGIVGSNAMINAIGDVATETSNIYADFTNTGINCARILKVDSCFNAAGNPRTSSKNIYIKMDPTGTLDMGGDIVWLQRHTYSFGSSGSNNYSGNGYNSQWTSYIYQLNPSKLGIMDNVVIDAPATGNCVLSCRSYGVKSPYICGYVWLGSSTLDIKRHYNNISTQNAVVVEGPSYYKCDDFEANLNYPGYSGSSQISWSPESQSSVYVNKSNCIIANEIPNTTIYWANMFNSLTCPNYIKTGQFFQRNSTCFAKSWNTVRTGSNSQGSLRFNNNSAHVDNYSYPLIVGQDPYSGIQIVPTSTGKKILTVYIAIKNMDVSELGYTGRIGIHVCCPEIKTDAYDQEKTNAYIHEFTSEGIGWQADSSTWSGDTNLRTYKCEIPIEVFTTEEPIDVKIWFNWYSVNGYVYVDPDFKLRDVVVE